jgi:hypothetical protein
MEGVLSELFGETNFLCQSRADRKPTVLGGRSRPLPSMWWPFSKPEAPSSSRAGLPAGGGMPPRAEMQLRGKSLPSYEEATNTHRSHASNGTSRPAPGIAFWGNTMEERLTERTGRERPNRWRQLEEGWNSELRRKPKQGTHKVTRDDTMLRISDDERRKVSRQ